MGRQLRSSGRYRKKRGGGGGSTSLCYGSCNSTYAKSSYLCHLMCEARKNNTGRIGRLCVRTCVAVSICIVDIKPHSRQRGLAQAKEEKTSVRVRASRRYVLGRSVEVCRTSQSQSLRTELLPAGKVREVQYGSRSCTVNANTCIRRERLQVYSATIRDRGRGSHPIVSRLSLLQLCLYSVALKASRMDINKQSKAKEEDRC